MVMHDLIGADRGRQKQTTVVFLDAKPKAIPLPFIITKRRIMKVDHTQMNHIREIIQV